MKKLKYTQQGTAALQAFFLRQCRLFSTRRRHCRLFERSKQWAGRARISHEKKAEKRTRGSFSPSEGPQSKNPLNDTLRVPPTVAQAKNLGRDGEGCRSGRRVVGDEDEEA
jgi:hypothetical protein